MSNRLPPIQAWFVPRMTPEGAAPIEIREQWIDIPLPLRFLSGEAPKQVIGHSLGDITDVKIITDAAEVVAYDAIRSFYIFDRAEIAKFWKRVVYSSDVLAFRSNEGELYTPPQIQRILPGIELFEVYDTSENLS